jgi:hypothetical protein
MYGVSGTQSYARFFQPIRPNQRTIHFGTTLVVNGAWQDWVQSLVTESRDDASLQRVIGVLPERLSEYLETRFNRDDSRMIAAAQLLENLQTSSGSRDRLSQAIQRVVIRQLAYTVLLYPNSPLPTEIPPQIKIEILKHLTRMDQILQRLRQDRTIEHAQGGAGIDWHEANSNFLFPSNRLVSRISSDIDTILTQNHDIFKALLMTSRNAS